MNLLRIDKHIINTDRILCIFDDGTSFSLMLGSFDNVLTIDGNDAKVFREWLSDRVDDVPKVKRAPKQRSGPKIRIPANASIPESKPLGGRTIDVISDGPVPKKVDDGNRIDSI